jgi:hypothetical protein
VRVPDYTPSTVYIAGAFPAGFEQWNPSAYPMMKVSDDPNIWERTFDLPDGFDLQYKFARGDWSKVEAWGSITGLSNRSVLISYGTDGTQLVDNTAIDWGAGPDDEKAVQLWVDPLVTGTFPAAGAVDVPVTTTIKVTWSKAMAPGTDFLVTSPSGPVAGGFSYDSNTDTVIFTPSAPLAPDTVYTVLVSEEISADADSSAQQEPHQFTFTTAKADEEEPPIPTGANIYLPLMYKP